MNTAAGYAEEEKAGNPTEKQLPGNPPTQTQTQLPGMTTTSGADNTEDQQDYQDLLMDYHDQLVDFDDNDTW